MTRLPSRQWKSLDRTMDDILTLFEVTTGARRGGHRWHPYYTNYLYNNAKVLWEHSPDDVDMVAVVTSLAAIGLVCGPNEETTPLKAAVLIYQCRHQLRKDFRMKPKAIRMAIEASLSSPICYPGERTNNVSELVAGAVIGLPFNDLPDAFQWLSGYDPKMRITYSESDLNHFRGLMSVKYDPYRINIPQALYLSYRKDFDDFFMKMRAWQRYI